MLLVCDPPQLAAMGRERAYIEIRGAMRAHASDVELQTEACRYALSVCGDVIKAAMGQERVYKEVQAAMRAHTGDLELQ